MVISLRKTIPDSSDLYGDGGDQTIVLNGIFSIMPHTKKDLIKINRAKTKAKQASSPSDNFDNQIIDLKQGTDEMVLRGWLEDDQDEGTATAGGATTMTDSGAAWEVNQFTGATLDILSGTGSGQSKTISSNTSTIITVDSSWATNPDSTSTYRISQTGWNKYWRLRAMCSTGGALTKFTLYDIDFDSTTQEAFLEDVSAVIKSTDDGELNNIANDGTARVEISLAIFIGDER